MARRILDFIDERIAGGNNPRDTGKPLTGGALGAFWRYRVGDFRIVCDIQDDEPRVLVLRIGHRREVYR
jgi:mRNA interferase RelE/StbE